MSQKLVRLSVSSFAVEADGQIGEIQVSIILMLPMGRVGTCAFAAHLPDT